MENCKICNTDKKSNGTHLYRCHKLTPREYYDGYLKKSLDDGKCLWCKKVTTFLSMNKGYRKFCNSVCCSKFYWKFTDSDKIEKRNSKIRETYSTIDKTVFRETGRRNWAIRTEEEREEVTEKHKETKLLKYGDRNYNNLEKLKKTNLERYGVDNYFKTDEMKTLLSDNKDEIDKKRKKTFINNYGVNHPMKLKSYKANYRRKIKESNFETFKIRLKHKQIEPLFGKEFYVKSNGLYRYKCLRCNTIFENYFNSVPQIACNKPIHKYRSKYEDEISAFLKENGIENIKKNARFYYDKSRFFEIDVLCEKIGIDFHGIYYHSELFKEKHYHSKKLQFFKERNIKFIQIFENEWVNKNGLVKSILKMKLGLNKKLYARKCECTELSIKEYKIFLERNHLLGYVPSSCKIGLKYKNELVTVMGFGKSRFKKGEIELLRFCNKKDISVIGGLSKLISFYIKKEKVNEIVSFCDLRYFDGYSYIKSGFEVEKIIQPNYFYFKSGQLELHNRLEFQKHKLKDKLEKFDEKLSEHDNMIENGYVRIFDAGNLKLRKKCILHK